MKQKVKVLFTQSCPILCDPMNCSPPGFSVHGILKARILEWIAIPFSRGSAQLSDWTRVSLIAGRVFTVWVTREVHIDFCFFLEFLCFFCDPEYDCNLISGSSDFSKSSLYIWKFSVHILLKPILKDFEHNLAGMWNECNCIVIWAFFGIAFLWDWNEKCPFPVPWPLLSFPYLLA